RSASSNGFASNELGTSQQPRTSPPPRSRYGSATRTPRLCAPSCAGSDAVPDLSPCLKTTSQHVASTLLRRPLDDPLDTPAAQAMRRAPASRTVGVGWL